MTNEALSTREFIRGAARFSDLCYFITQDKSLLRSDVPHTVMAAVDQGDWGDNFRAKWTSTAIAIAQKPQQKGVCIAIEGEVRTYVGGKTTDEQLSPRPNAIRNARCIDGEVYACGMLRQVYRRTGEAAWVDISAPAPAKKHVAGFESIDGFGAFELYAAGWGGEIWRYDGTRWHEIASPTNVLLTSVCCAEDGTVYVAGHGGVMLRGRKDSWALVHWEEPVTAQLWDLCWFADRLYVATINHLFTLVGEKLVPVDFGAAAPGTCYSLCAADGVLWSTGRDDVVSFDGTRWTKYT